MPELEKKNAVLVAIVVDDVKKNRALAEKQKLGFPILSDTKRTVTKAYGIHDEPNDIAWPAIFILDGDRKVRWRSLAETYPVRPAAQVVLDALVTSLAK